MRLRNEQLKSEFRKWDSQHSESDILAGIVATMVSDCSQSCVAYLVARSGKPQGSVEEASIHGQDEKMAPRRVDTDESTSGVDRGTPVGHLSSFESNRA